MPVARRWRRWRWRLVAAVGWCSSTLFVEANRARGDCIFPQCRKSCKIEQLRTKQCTLLLHIGRRPLWRALRHTFRQLALIAPVPSCWLVVYYLVMSYNSSIYWIYIISQKMMIIVYTLCQFVLVEPSLQGLLIFPVNIFRSGRFYFETQNHVVTYAAEDRGCRPEGITLGETGTGSDMGWLVRALAGLEKQRGTMSYHQ